MFLYSVFSSSTDDDKTVLAFQKFHPNVSGIEYQLKSLFILSISCLREIQHQRIEKSTSKPDDESVLSAYENLIDFNSIKTLSIIHKSRLKLSTNIHTDLLRTLRFGCLEVQVYLHKFIIAWQEIDRHVSNKFFFLIQLTNYSHTVKCHSLWMTVYLIISTLQLAISDLTAADHTGPKSRHVRHWWRFL